MSRPLYVTTTIPYVNAPPHIGHALELVQADAIARYHRLCGTTVRFQTGTDENALKNVLSARAKGVSVQSLVDENAARFRALAASLGVSVDRFIRTSEPAHHRAVGTFLSRLAPEDLSMAEYRGSYCVGCEDFYQPGELVDGRCPEHDAPLVELAETNVFFALSRYQDQLRELITSRRIHIVPDAREAEVLAFIDRGLRDISISRSAARSEGWGIPFPGVNGQVVYVWIDALINYLTGLGFPEQSNVDAFWERGDTCHVIGKNVWKFHAIYWPALLLSAGISPPRRIVVHGFLTSDGRKISKSSGDPEDPTLHVDRFGADAVRYFLLRHVRPFDDSDFASARLAAVYENELANGLGNLVSRLSALAEAAELEGAESGSAPADYHESFADFRLDLALGALWSEVSRLNREINDQRPWDLIRRGDLVGARDVLRPIATRLASLGWWLEPFLPSTSCAIRSAFSTGPIRRALALFPRDRVQRAAATATPG